MLHEISGGHASKVCAGENFALRSEAGGGEIEKKSVVFFDSKDLAFVVAGEGGGIEDDIVEGPPLFGEAAEPVEGISPTKVMILRRHSVEAEVFPSPVEVNLREVKGRGDGASGSGGDREEASISKCV